MKKLVLVFEGIDKSGKDTIIKEFQKLTDCRYVIVNRFIGSNWVYSKFKNRETVLELSRYIELDKSMSSNFIQVYLYASKKDLMQRIKNTKETDIKIKDIDEILALYGIWLEITSMNTIVLDTSAYSAEKCAELLWSSIKNI